MEKHARSRGDLIKWITLCKYDASIIEKPNHPFLRHDAEPTVNLETVVQPATAKHLLDRYQSQES